jgi:hypothetical protein
MLARSTALIVAAVTAVAVPAAAVPLPSPNIFAADPKSIDVSPGAPVALFGLASPPFSDSARGDRDFSQMPMVPAGFYIGMGTRPRAHDASRSVLKEARASPAADGDLLAFFVGREKVAIFTEDQAFSAAFAARYRERQPEDALRYSVYQEVKPGKAINWLGQRQLESVALVVGMGLPLLVLVFYLSNK